MADQGAPVNGQMMAYYMEKNRRELADLLETQFKASAGQVEALLGKVEKNVAADLGELRRDVTTIREGQARAGEQVAELRRDVTALGIDHKSTRRDLDHLLAEHRAQVDTYHDRKTENREWNKAKIGAIVATLAAAGAACGGLVHLLKG